jgi:SAM-dependent methyltransferase
MHINKSLKILNPQTRFKERRQIIETTLNQVFPNKNQAIKILEAGCGKWWALKEINRKFEITGVDISSEALEYRLNTQKDLANYKVGDLRNIEIENNSFDAIYSNYVLEHIKGSEIVLQNFLKWLKNGGIIIVQVPDRNSTAAFFSRFSPHFIHVLYYKYVKGRKNAGEPGHGPFEAYYDKILSIDGFRRFSENNGCKILAEIGILAPYKGFSFFSKILQLLSLGKLSHNHNGLLYIFQKEPQKSL